MPSKKATPDAALVDFVHLPWSRASAYVIDGDGMIAPHPEAEFSQTNPWKSYLQGGLVKDSSGLPHLAFAELAPRPMWTVAPMSSLKADSERRELAGGWLFQPPRTLLRTDVRTPRRMTRESLIQQCPKLSDEPEVRDPDQGIRQAFEQWQLENCDRKAILDWVGRYGLLGLLLHRHVTLADPTRNPPFCFARTVKGWSAFDGAPARTGTLRFHAMGFLEPDPGDGWKTWLRTSSSCHGIKQLPSKEFFRAYREPLSEFVSAAHALYQTMKILASEPAADAGPLLQGLWTAERSKLDMQLSMGVQLTTAAVHGRLGQELRCHSLMGALLLMAFEDLSRRNTTALVACEYCGTIVRRKRGAKTCSRSHTISKNVQTTKARQKKTRTRA